MRNLTSYLLSLLLILGIFLSRNYVIPTYLIFSLLSICCLLILFFKSSKIFIVSICFCALLIGIIRFQQMETNFLNEFDQKPVTVTGKILAIQHNDVNKYIMKTEIINEKNFSEKIIITNFGKHIFNIGDRVTLKGKFSVPRNNGNPGLFNYREYLGSKKIWGILTTKDSFIEKTSDSGDIWLNARRSFVNYTVNLFDSKLDMNNSNIIKTIILGDYYINEDTNDQVKSLGIPHLFAISGFHIGILFIFLSTLLGMMNMPKIYIKLIVLSIILIYGLLIGMPPSVQRALLMITVINLAIQLKKPWNRILSLNFAILVMLLINPFTLFSAGFQFSVASTFAILYVYPKLENRYKPSIRLLDSLLLITSVYIIILPIQIFYFNSMGIGFIIGNIIILPIFSVSIATGYAMLVIGLTGLYQPFFYIYNLLLNVVRLSISGASNFTTNLIVPSPSIWLIVLYYIILFILLNSRMLFFIKAKDRIFISKLLIYYLTANLALYCLYQPVILNTIDIGQGDAALLRFGNTSYLFDTGGSYKKDDTSGKNILVPYLVKNNIRKLDVFITHFDEDHSGNISELQKNNLLGKVLSRIDGDKILKDKYKLVDIDYVSLKDGDSIFKPYFSIESLVPSINTNNENEKSIVFFLRLHSLSILVTGDIQEIAEKHLLNYRIKSDILKVPHHGSKTSSTEEFINKVDPKLGIISVGYNNMYNLPNKDILSRYETLNIPLLRTDIDGNIEIYSHRFGYFIRTFRNKTNILDEINSISLISPFITVLFVLAFLLRKEDKHDKLY